MDNLTKKVLSEIAEIQIEALKRIKQNPEEVDQTLLTAMFGADSSDLVETVDRFIQFYEQVKGIPYIIKMANEYQLGVCSHILFIMEDEWLKTNPEGVRGAWQVLCKAAYRYHPEYKLII